MQLVWWSAALNSKISNVVCGAKSENSHSVSNNHKRLRANWVNKVENWLRLWFPKKWSRRQWARAHRGMRRATERFLFHVIAAVILLCKNCSPAAGGRAAHVWGGDEKGTTVRRRHGPWTSRAGHCRGVGRFQGVVRSRAWPCNFQLETRTGSLSIANFFSPSRRKRYIIYFISQRLIAHRARLPSREFDCRWLIRTQLVDCS